MPPSIFEMKIIKHTFKIPKLDLSDEGDLIEVGNIEETYTFTLLHKGIGIFEEMAGKPLISFLTTMAMKDEEEMLHNFLDKSFIPNLACASYVKIENGHFHNNRSTAEEFKKSNVYPHLTEDIDFITKLVEMAVDCVLGEQASLSKTKQNANSKK